jgi:hypothetical protein
LARHLIVRKLNTQILISASPVIKKQPIVPTKMTYKHLFFPLFFLPSLLFAQKKYTLSGYVKDSLNGETLIGATISVKDKTRGVNSNQYGFYSLTLSEGTYELVVSYVGFLPSTIPIQLNEDKQLNFDLVPRGALAEVVVSTKKRDANIKNANSENLYCLLNKLKQCPLFWVRLTC